MECRLLRPHVRPAARDGAGRHRPPRPPRGRARARRRLRHGPRHRGAPRARPERHADRGRRQRRRWSTRRASGSATASRRSPSTCSSSSSTEPVDAILSTATFHWIADHERLFARLHAALRPGGRFVAQCGGAGQHRQRAGGDRRRRPSRRCAAGPARGTSPTPEQTTAAAEGRRLHRHLDVAAALAGRPAGPARVLRDRDPRLAPRAPPGRGARARSSTTCSRSWTSPSARTTCG